MSWYVVNGDKVLGPFEQYGEAKVALDDTAVSAYNGKYGDTAAFRVYRYGSKFIGTAAGLAAEHITDEPLQAETKPKPAPAPVRTDLYTRVTVTYDDGSTRVNYEKSVRIL